VKQERIAHPPAVGSATESGAELSQQIMNMMEQGILVWSADGVWVLHNTRIFQVTEMAPADLAVGTTMDEFRERALARGEVAPQDMEASDRQVAIRAPCAYDRRLPSGRVVLTNGRPSRGGGYVFTFTDVTAERRAARELQEVKHAAEARWPPSARSGRARPRGGSWRSSTSGFRPRGRSTSCT
jgi:PAS domain-containing protein